jgi:hypothetical protein
MRGGLTRVGLQGRLVAAIALLVLVVACDKKGSEDSTPIPTAPTLPTGTTVTVSSLEVSGPAQMTPGETAQFTVIARMSDSTSMEPTGVKWIASPPSFLQVDQSGLVTAMGMGGAAVTAEIAVAGVVGGVVRASKGVIVLPAGTFLLVGTVSDSEFFPAPLEGALVEVTPGSLSATTNSDGFYRIYGVTPGAEMRITKPGYEPVVHALGLTSHGRQDFALTVSGPRLNLSGAYTLAVDAADGCAGLPADLQHRRYDAALTQNGLTLNVALTEPRFQLTQGRGNRFGGRVDGTDVTFKLGYFDLGWDWNIDPVYPDIAERLPNGSFLVVSGTAVGKASADGIVGTIDGALTNLDSRYPAVQWELGSCAGKHRFTLTRR